MSKTKRASNVPQEPSPSDLASGDVDELRAGARDAFIVINAMFDRAVKAGDLSTCGPAERAVCRLKAAIERIVNPVAGEAVAS